MDTVQQCPRCELRFRSQAEVADHLLTDHREDGQHLADELTRLRTEPRSTRYRRVRAPASRLRKTGRPHRERTFVPDLAVEGPMYGGA